MSSQKKIAKSCFSISFKKTRWLIVVQWGSEYRMFKIRKHFKSRPFISRIQIGIHNSKYGQFTWSRFWMAKTQSLPNISSLDHSTTLTIWNRVLCISGLKLAEKKCFDQLSGARSNQKLVKLHNNQDWLNEWSVI